MSQRAALCSLDRRLCKFFHLDEPLIGKHRLNDRMASVTFPYRNDFFLCFDQVSGFIQILDPRLSALVAVHSLVLAGKTIHPGVKVDAGKILKIVTLSYFEVVRIVSRRDLNSTCPLLRIRIRVSDHRDLPAYQRKDHVLAYQILVSFIIRMYCDSHIAEHGLRTGSSHYNTFASVSSRIAEIPVHAVLIFVLYLGIRKGSPAFRTPVDETVAFIDQALAVQLHEEVIDRFVAALVHGEALSAPVAGIAQLAALLGDLAAELFLPVPGSL